MADIRSIGTSVVPQQTGGAVRGEAARAAQRAFFQAALSGISAPAAAAPRTTPVASVQPTRAETQPQPERMLRPGSLLDIKV